MDSNTKWVKENKGSEENVINQQKLRQENKQHRVKAQQIENTRGIKK